MLMSFKLIKFLFNFMAHFYAMEIFVFFNANKFVYNTDHV